MFSGAGIELGPEKEEKRGGYSQGDRQKLAERYLSTISWDSDEDVSKILQAVEIALFSESTSPEHKEKLRALCEKEGVQIEGEKIFLPSNVARTQKALPNRRRSSVAEFDIFVSWSRPGSRQAAEAFKEWLPEALPGAKPWMSKQDISKGRPWFASVSEQLSRSNACLVCVTPENVASPWLYFEAGAVAHAIPGAPICSYLIEVNPAELSGTPLGQYQATVFEKDDTWRLIRDLHHDLGAPHDEGLLKRAFDKSWPSLQRKLARVAAAVKPVDDTGQPDQPDEPDLSEEAKHVLIEASKDERGVVAMTKNMHGFDLVAHGMQLVDGMNPRIEAAYREAVNDLVSRRLFEPRGDKGESFALTSRGWAFADKLRGVVPK
jgi:hypothetical protein